MKLFLLLGLALIGMAFGRVMLEQRTADLDEAVINKLGWERAAIARPSTMPHRFFIAIKQDGVELLEQKFNTVSDPDHADYSNYWTREQVMNTVKPNPVSLAAVSEWLSAAGVEFSTAGHGDFLKVEAPIGKIEALLGVEMWMFKHPSAKHQLVRSLRAASVPEEVAEHIDFVSAINNFPVLSEVTNDVSLPFPGDLVTPAVLKKLYQITDVFSGKSKASQGLAEFQDQTYSPSDLAKFEAQYNLPSQTLREVTPNGKGSGQVEASLDVQYIIATGQGVPTDFWLESGFSFDVLAWITSVAASKETANVWSVSYGESENVVQPSYCQRLNTEFMKLGAQGVSVIFASGDSGVYSRQSSGPVFDPGYPGALPAVTTVGATFSTNGVEDSVIYFSGGGFGHTKYFPQPKWQKKAVAAYFAEQQGQLPPQQDYEAAGRGFPDVSALGTNFNTYTNGFAQPVSGTSAATPAFAGVISLLNDARMQVGKKPLGFLNPFLYKNADAFNDITKGDNNNNEQWGFHAAQGWDPASGLGSPNYQKLKKAALALP